MKVLVNAISAKKGGIVTYTANLIKSFKEREVDAVFAVSPDFPDKDTMPTIVTNASDFSPAKRFFWEQTVWRKQVIRSNPDVLFSSANFGLAKSPVPQVLLLREGGLFDNFYLSNIAPSQGFDPAIKRIIRRKLMLMSAKEADYIMTPTAAMRDMIIEWAPEIRDKCSVNSYGTLSSIFTPLCEPRRWMEDGTLRLLYVSVYYPHKNPGIIAEVANLLNESGIKTQATITMTMDEVSSSIGGNLDYAQLARGVDRGVVNLGRHHYSKLPDLYRSHDIFIFPSVSETFGHPMVEALSTGLPVIASDTSVNREICGDAAVYFKPFSLYDLRDAIMFLNESSSVRNLLAEQGRKRVISSFDWDAHVDRLLSIFKEVSRK